MKALLRPVFVGVLSIVIAATSLVGSASMALAVTPPLVPTWWLDLPVYEGAKVVLHGTFTGGVGVGPYTVEVYWWGEFSGIPSETYALTLESCPPPEVCSVDVPKADPYVNDQPDPITIAVYLNDRDKTNSSNVEAFTISNAAPSFESFGLSTTNPEIDQAVTASGTFTDGGANDTHSVTLNWGDGTPETTTSLGAALTFTTEAHTYTTVGEFTVRATVKDDAGAPDDATATVTVLPSNHAPTGLAFDATPTGSNVVVTGSFTDPDTTDTHTLTVNWGDDVSTPHELAPGETAFTASHVYEASGTYTVTATVTDHPAGASTSPLSKTVVVTVPATNASDVIDEMTLRVRSFDLDFELDRNTERWLLKKLDDLQDSLAYGNGQVCSSTGTLSHFLAFAQRTLTSEQYAALSTLATKLEAAAGCTSTGSQLPKVRRAGALITTVTPAHEVRQAHGRTW